MAIDRENKPRSNSRTLSRRTLLKAPLAGAAVLAAPGLLIGEAHAAWEIGLFHRHSSTMRLHAGDEEGATELLVGREDGVAMQARSRHDGATVFAACSGLDPVYLGRELERAHREGGGPGAAEGELWPLGRAVVSIDRDAQ